MPRRRQKAREIKKRAERRVGRFPAKRLLLLFSLPVFVLDCFSKKTSPSATFHFPDEIFRRKTSQQIEHFQIETNKKTGRRRTKQNETKTNKKNHSFLFTLRSARNSPKALSKKACSSATSLRRSNLPDLEKCPAPRSHLKTTGPRGLPSSRMRATHCSFFV